MRLLVMGSDDMWCVLVGSVVREGKASSPGSLMTRPWGMLAYQQLTGRLVMLSQDAVGGNTWQQQWWHAISPVSAPSCRLAAAAAGDALMMWGA